MQGFETKTKNKISVLFSLANVQEEKFTCLNGRKQNKMLRVIHSMKWKGEDRWTHPSFSPHTVHYLRSDLCLTRSLHQFLEICCSVKEIRHHSDFRTSCFLYQITIALKREWQFEEALNHTQFVILCLIQKFITP